jgi:hypothetical protein
MKSCLTNLIYGDGNIFPGRDPAFDPVARADARDWPAQAHTMIGTRRLDNLQACVEDVLAGGVPGDLIETGVWRGGATIFMRALLEAYEDPDRKVWVADSFQGLPLPDPSRYPLDRGTEIFASYKELAIPLEKVKDNFARYGLLDERVRFLPGWFRDTLPVAPIERLAVLRLDGDMYESTMEALVHLYPKLSVGGYCIIDDYELPTCRCAVADYRKRQGISEPITTVDWAAVYWKKTASKP